MRTTHWEHFPHDADIGVRGIGASKEEAFAQAALAVTAVLTDPAAVAQTDSVAITCEAPDDELLFVDWLNALVYEMATRQTLFSRFDIHFDDEGLHATAWGEAVDIAAAEYGIALPDRELPVHRSILPSDRRI